MIIKKNCQIQKEAVPPDFVVIFPGVRGTTNTQCTKENYARYYGE